MSDVRIDINALPIASVGNLVDRAVITQSGVSKTLALSLFPVSNPVKAALDLKELLSNKGTPNGYAGLGSDGKIPISQLGSGIPDGTKFLGDDGVFAHPPAASGSPGTVAFSAITGIYSDNTSLNNVLATKENTSNKGVANGYASLNSGGIVPATQLGTGGSNTDFLRKDGTWATPSAGASTIAFVSITGLPTDNTALASALSAKQNTISYTTENVANKATSFAIVNNVLYPTIQAVNNVLAGYATLVAGKVPIANLGSGTPDGTKFLRDDGLFVTPTTILPSQTGNAGKYLTTDGTTASWGTVVGGSGIVDKPYTTVAFSGSSYTLNVADSANNIKLTGVNTNFTLNLSGVTSGATKTLRLNKSTAGAITVTIPNINSLPPSITLNSTLITAVTGSSSVVTINAGNNAIIWISVALVDDIACFTFENIVNINAAVDASANIKLLKSLPGRKTATNATGEQEVARWTLPALLKSYSSVKVELIFRTATTGQSNVQYKLRIGNSGTLSANTIFDDYGRSNAGALERKFTFTCQNSLTSQTFLKGYAEYIPSATPDVTSATVDFSVPQDMIFSLDKTGINDTAELINILIYGIDIL